MNTIQLTGGLTRDPELKSVADDQSVCEMRVAVSRPRSRDRSDYFTVVAWDGLAEVCAAHLEKGRQIAVSGRIEYREWDNTEGVRREAYSVVADQIDFLGGPRGEDSTPSNGAEAPAPDEEPVPL